MDREYERLSYIQIELGRQRLIGLDRQGGSGRDREGWREMDIEQDITIDRGIGWQSQIYRD